MNVNRFAQTPGIDETASGIFSQRSGLGGKSVGQPIIKNKIENRTYLNSTASSPQIDLSRLTMLIGIVID